MIKVVCNFIFFQNNYNFKDANDDKGNNNILKIPNQQQLGKQSIMKRISALSNQKLFDTVKS